MSESNQKGQIAEILESSFWKTWIGKTVIVLVAGWFLPRDKIIDQFVKPGAKAVGEVAGLGWDKYTVPTIRKIRNWAVGFLAIGVLVFWASLFLAINYGIRRGNGYVVAGAGLLWSAYLLVCLIQLRTVGLFLVDLANRGLVLAQDFVGKLFEKIGLAKSNGEHVAISPEVVWGIIKTGQYILAGSLISTVILSVTTFISKTPPWLSTGIFLLGAVAALAAISISSIEELGIDTKPTWINLSRYMKYVATVAIAGGVILALFPNLAGKIAAARDSVNAWMGKSDHVLQPWMLVAIPVVLYVVSRILSAYYGKDSPKKSAVWATVAKGSIGLTIGTIIYLMATGSLTYPHIKDSAKRFAYGNSIAPMPASLEQKPASVVDKRVVEALPPAPAPEPDFKGKSAKQIYEEFLGDK